MRVLYIEGVAICGGPESCVGLGLAHDPVTYRQIIDRAA